MAALAVTLTGLGVRWWLAPAEEASVAAPGAGRQITAPMVFQDGRWVRLDGSQVRDLLRHMASRTPGLVALSGVVRDVQTGQPVPGAEVVFAGGGGEWSALAGDDGRYRIEVRAGFYRAFARADGYVAVGRSRIDRLPTAPEAGEAGLPQDELAPIFGAFRDQRSVDIDLHGAAEIVGTVYDDRGRPVTGAIVSAHAGPAQARLRPVLGTDLDETDWDGSFRLEVPAGMVAVTAAHHDFAGTDGAHGRATYLRTGDRVRVDLTLVAGCIVTGRVVDARGRPVGPGSLERWVGGTPPHDYVPAERIGDDGRFRFARVEPGAVRLRAWPWRSPPAAPQEVSCRNGARFDLAFQIPDQDADLEGSIATYTGEPVPEAYIDVLPLSPGGMAQQERADVFGEWAVYALPAGEYQVLAHVPGHGVAAERVTVPSRGIRLALSGTGSLAGTALGIDDGAFTLVVEQCALRDPDGHVTRFDEVTMPATTHLVPVEGGRFRVDDLPACPLRARAVTEHGSAAIDETIRAGQVIGVTLDLRRPGDRW